MMKHKTYLEVTPEDLNHSVTWDIEVDDLKYLYNLLEDVHEDMIGYKHLQAQILQVLKDHNFEQKFNELPF